MRSIVLMLVLSLALTAGARASGLLAPTDQTLPPLRVTDHVVETTIRDQIAITTLTQTFHNDTRRRLEATYVFPLPEQSDLTDFQMTFNGKMVQGQVLPADEARRIYESIVRQSRDPGLIEFIGRRLLQMRVFPIEPGSDTTIQVRYQQVCRPLSGMHAYHYPLRTSRTAGRAYGTVRFSVRLDTAAALKSIWSPTHAVEIVRDGERGARVEYEASGGSLEDDFLLLYDTESSDVGLSAVAWKPRAAEPGHFVLTLTPKQLWDDGERAAQDVVFVIDTSGSMAGEKLQQAKASLKYCVDQLQTRDRFSVVRFSTGFDVLFEPLATATAERRAEARTWIDRFTAAGGTNITDTLLHVMAMRPGAAGDDEGRGERPYVVVFLTDGQGNRPPEELMKALSSAAGGAGMRIFPFGVGHDVNTILLDRLANEHQGRPTYVQPGENLELVLGDFFSVVSRPVLTGLRLSLPGVGATERFPAALGDLYHGQQIVVAGRFDRAVTGEVALSATRNGERVEFRWPDVAFTHEPAAGFVPSVWAGRKIAYLIDQIRAHGESDEMVREIIELSQAHGIQTPYSSWLVNPEGRPVVAWRRGGTGGGGGFGAGAPRGRRPPSHAPQAPPGPGVDAQREILERRLGVLAGETVSGSIEGEDLELYHALGDELALSEEAGKTATIIARYNATLRDRASRDDGRVASHLLARQRHGERWYNRIGSYLVDERLDPATAITIVRFGSDAYFELSRNRADLRGVLASDRHVVLMAADGQAVLIADDEGIESFTDELRDTLNISG